MAYLIKFLCAQFCSIRGRHKPAPWSALGRFAGRAVALLRLYVIFNRTLHYFCGVYPPIICEKGELN
jgi:hypothetical protein